MTATIGPIQHHESRDVECWCRHCVWWKDKAVRAERARLAAHLADALEKVLFDPVVGIRRLMTYQETADAIIAALVPHDAAALEDKP